MFFLKRVLFCLLLIGALFFSFQTPAFAQICNIFAGGSCGNTTCDPRTQDPSTDACFGNGNCCYLKSSYPDTCHWNGKVCQCTSEANTIPSICVDGGQSTNEGPYGNFSCGTGAICADSGYITCETGLSDTNAFCARLGHTCPSNYTSTYANNSAANDCGSQSNSEAICCTQIQSCNTTVKSGSCTANSIGANTCGFYAGSIPKTYTQYVHSGCFDTDPAGLYSFYTCTASSVCNQASAGSTSCTTGFIDNCYANYTCSGNNVCVTHIYVTVYTDYNHDGVKNGNDAGKSGVSISDGGGNTFQTDGSGNVTFSGKATGSYTITETVPTNFKAVNATSQTVNLTNSSGDVHIYFYLTPLYSISGRVFNDKNKDQKYDGADTGYGGGTITATGGPTTVANMTAAADGTWATPTNLESGNYTVSYTTALPAGYQFTTPSSYTITVGNPAGSPVCNTGGSLDATCGGTNNGSIANLDFGLSNENQWGQSICFDVRDDSGSYSDLIPAAPNCGGVTGAYDSITNADCSTGAGIIFTCDATPNFGLGSANANNWQAGGTSPNNECFTGAGLDVIRTSYDYLLTTARQSNITLVDMTTICGAGGLANCTLSSNLTKGVYLAQGDVYLNTYTFPVDPATPQGFIFLINGNLHLQGNIIIPAGSVAAFSTSGNIYVDPSVGNVISNPSDPAVNNPNIEGLYSADANFIVQSYGTTGNYCNLDGTPLDKKLNVVGSIITNAAQRGGSYQDNRDLCIYDTSCPSSSVGDDNGLGLSYILTLFADGGFLNHKTFNWQELKP